jgi:hypothetical protein
MAEGNGKATSGDRRRYFEIARGSALECAAIEDVRRCAMRCPQTTTASKRHCSMVLWPCSRSSDSVARRSASLADIGLISSIPTPIPTPTPIGVPNESAGDTQAKNLCSLFLHHHSPFTRTVAMVFIAKAKLATPLECRPQASRSINRRCAQPRRPDEKHA